MLEILNINKTLEHKSFLGLDCVDGVCKNQLSYFSNYDNDMSLKECIIYLSFTPLIYFTILIILEERLPHKFYAKILNQNLKNPCDIKDDQVKKEKHVVAVEIRKLLNRGIVFYKYLF